MSNDKLSSAGNRLRQPTPPFWKKVRNWSAVVVAVAIAIKGAPDDIDLPAWLVSTANYALFVCSTLAVAAQATVKNPNEQ